MYPNIDTKDTHAVQACINSIYRELYPNGNPAFISDAFSWAVQCFSGNYKNYLAIDARYHDLEHTMQGALCMARLLHGRSLAGASPQVPQGMFELGTIAILLHDTGYLKKREDLEGTGAKYTLVHVTRSTELAAELLREKGFAWNEIKAVQNMIRCTGVNVDLASIPFQSDLERLLGFALGTADLLGQMAAPDYIEKLPILYNEFEESAAFNKSATSGGGNMFSSAEDLMRKTPGFWQFYVLPKINKDFLGLYQFLAEVHPNKENWYIQRIEENIASLQTQLQAA